MSCKLSCMSSWEKSYPQKHSRSERLKSTRVMVILFGVSGKTQWM